MTNNQLWPFIPADAKLLVELGDGDSGTKEYYQRINPQGQYISIDGEDPQADILPSSVDCLLCHDYLSHLRQPGVFLEQAATWLQPEGQVLARVANPQHWHRIVQLLRGNSIEPTRNRVSQRNPVSIELFTLNNIKELFAAAGLRVYEIQTIDNKGEEFPEFLRLMAPTIQALGIDSTTFATQTGAAEYLIRATKSPTPPRRLFIQTILMAPTGCDRVRVIEPDSFSATIPGVRTFSQVKTADLTAGLPNEEKVFIWQRTILSYPDSIAQLKQLLQRDYLIVAEIDDDPLRRPEYEQNQFLSYRGCHCVQTSTEPLAAYLRQHNPNVALFPNQLAYLPRFVGANGHSPLQPKKNDEVITIFFGALNRENDWQPIMASLNKILSQHQGRVRCQVIHDRRFFDGLETAQKEFTPFSPYERYLEILAGCDIALLPLGETRINSMKSDLKFLECAGHGAAVLASPTVYEKSIIDGETGLIYHNSTEFETLLNQLITDGEMRQRLATNAYNWVAQNRLLCQHYRQRRDWYLQMRDQLPRLNQELRDRVPELFQ